MTVEDMKPTDAVALYLEDRAAELADLTLAGYRSRLGTFTDWLDVDMMSEITPLILKQYKAERAPELAEDSLKGQLDTLRHFIRWSETLGLVESGMHKSVVSPAGGEQRSTTLSAERADAILGYLERYERASFDHTLLTTMWHTSLRTGSLRALDVEDIHTGDGWLDVQHRPETNTPLKNGNDGERPVSISPRVADLLSEHLHHRRIDKDDDSGRTPFFTSRYGRRSATNIRMIVYRWTRPCVIGQECPVGRDPAECEAAVDNRLAGKCPESVSPHAIRRGAITHFLSEDVEPTDVSARADVSMGVLRKHYDVRTPHDKMNQRRGSFDAL
ncbi:site-specific integrase (plasmid) [Salinirubellus salinus]|uniref:Site-specific integrase n=1 Tax=Salinirubellus salinus TaxID=1364945 RepID=A0A9E7R7N4_9EURY|nr:site-specific integrase [Salinirubellus salinus]UWM56951.1 site-specific integrase [Salinirubellus salinus]